MLARVSLSQSDGDLIVCLPEEVAFPSQVREVVITRQGAGYVLTPAESAWDDFFEAPSCDFPERDQPKDQRRETFDVVPCEDRDGGTQPPSA
jgi:antitoxin VapB